MSEIVIRHAEPKDYDAIRQIHAQPEVYHNTLQVPHPSMGMWQERLTERVGIKQLVACIDDIVAGHLCIEVTQRPRRSHVADFGICVDARWQNRGVASALLRQKKLHSTPLYKIPMRLAIRLKCRKSPTQFQAKQCLWITNLRLRSIKSMALRSKGQVRNTACATASTWMHILWHA